MKLAVLFIASVLAGAGLPARERTHTVPAGAAGFYAIEDSSLQVDAARSGRVPLRVWVDRVGRPVSAPIDPAVATSLAPGEFFDFDAFLGYLAAGDTIHVRLGEPGDATTDRSTLDFKVVRVPSIPVSVFPDDLTQPRPLAAPGGWRLADNLPAGSASARHLVGDDRPAGPLRLGAGARRESVALFRVPQSGYYALHDASFRADAPAVEARLYVDRESTPRRTFPVAIAGTTTSLNADLGYLPRGGTIAIAFAPTAGGSGATIDFRGSIVEWAPRRPPLRVRRGTEGRLAVFAPGAPRDAVGIPAGRWITVPATDGDATDAIRRAFTAAQELPEAGLAYAGVQLEPGATYTVGSSQTGGAIFQLRDARRIVFDGRGAALHVNSPELARREVTLFAVQGGREIAFVDFTVTAPSVPFTTGAVLAVTPPNASTQTVTFRATPGAPDPRADISRDGQADAYAYDPATPGRLAPGSWTHYPGRGNPPLQPGTEPGVFTHSVTRTNNSIHVGDRWLVKNKRGGVIYLATRGAEDITLAQVTGQASGGGHLRFSSASGINVLDCRFEPEGENWISSSADSVHGRGREGPWIENTLIRGICEDVMNTYGQSLVIVADDTPDDATMTIRLFDGSVESTRPPVLHVPSPDSLQAGDQLVFFNPKSGRVLGYARILAYSAGRVSLSNPVADIDTWETGDGRSATMVYNTRVAARFFVRDSRIMDSMRFGIYLKARGGTVFGSQFEGLSAPAILATNEPEWPEGPPATHLWVQGCTFSENNTGYMPQHRAFMVVDPADISIYTRRLRDPAEPAGHTAHVTHGQFANSHVKLVGNVFHAWRGMGIAVRNARNVAIRDNLFLPPADDAAMRQTLARDPVLAPDGRGGFAAIFLASVDGVQLGGNAAYGLRPGDQLLARADDATGVTADHPPPAPALGGGPEIHLPFNEWFGLESLEAEGVGAARDRVTLRGARHAAGRLGGGLVFDGTGAPAVLAPSVDFPAGLARTFTLALWVRPARSDGTQVVFQQGARESGLAVGIVGRRWFATVWSAGAAASLDLGPALAGTWQHLALVHDADTRTLRGFVDGLELARIRPAMELADAPRGDCTLGGASGPVPTLPHDTPAATFAGGLDEFAAFRRALDDTEVSLLALRRPENER